MKVIGDQLQPSGGQIVFTTEPVVSGGPKNLGDAPYPITASDGFNLIHSLTPLTVNRTVTLPSAAAPGVLGRKIAFKKLDTSSFSLLIAPNGSDTIDLLNVTYGLLNQFGAQVTLQCVSTSAWTVVQASGIAPTITKYTAPNSSGTYTKPNFATRLEVIMVGGGGGGAASGTGPTGGTGGTTTFGSSFLTCTGGIGGQTSTNNAGAAGGTATIGAGAIGTAVPGGIGQNEPATPYGTYPAGGSGAATPLGAGGGGACNLVGWAGPTNTGGGGGAGGGINVAQSVGQGGCSGGYINAIVYNPQNTYSYTVGNFGAGATSTGGNNGGNGSGGYIEIREFYC